MDANMSQKEILITSSKPNNALIPYYREIIHHAMCYRYSPSQSIFNIKSHCDIIKNDIENKISVDDDERVGFPRVSGNSDFNRYFTSKMWFYYVTIATM